MNKPITVTVRREHGNSGDCIFTATDANGAQESMATPGDCSAYSALTTVREFVEKLLNAEHVPADGVQFVQDPRTGDVSKLVNGVEVERTAPPAPETKDSLASKVDPAKLYSGSKADDVGGAS